MRPDQQFHHWHQQIPVESKIDKINGKKIFPTAIFMTDKQQLIYLPIFS